ncbi:carbohydrate ABC transporter permease [Paenibacillus sp. N3.4]|uniref:carbohydrate ABC transporter permease n=1 Tax=Paenibacillus sp. N3.4 TaxID=2603222 RepID=UPI0011C96866|nr:sugar ABC transporter permease [Paenibacillus sp. N3.4]TXK85044.1 sugar ABC transporter permease [Paenibacillus sp. N3.4]
MKVKNKWGRYKKSDVSWAFLMIAPNVLGLAFFFMWPIIQTIYFSFTKWGDFGTYKWAGLINYQRMLQDPNIWSALKNTSQYTFISVPIGIALSIFIAVLLNQKIRYLSLYRTLYFLPVVTMPAAIAMVWRWMYNSDYGLINQFLSIFSIKGPGWIIDPHVAPFSLIMVGIWSSIGYNMIIFLAGLQGISKSYYEAADIDGANPFVQFFRITLPVLSPTIFFATIISLINAFQVFDLIWMMIGEKNASISATQSLVYLFYKQAFILSDKGYAAGIAVLLFVIILVVTVVQMRLQKKWVHYE